MTSAAAATSIGTIELMRRLAAGLAPDLPMHRYRTTTGEAGGGGAFTQWAGLWGTWWLNGENQAAKVVLVTTVGEEEAGARPDYYTLHDPVAEKDYSGFAEWYSERGGILLQLEDGDWREAEGIAKDPRSIYGEGNV